MGIGRLMLLAVVSIVACGGRSRSEHEMGSSGGTGGSATGAGGTTGGIVIGSGAASSEGGRTASPCGRLEVDYLARSLAGCGDLSFVCAPGSAVFADDCGCGCTSTPFHEGPAGMLETDTVPDACRGPSGPLALFERSPEHLILGDKAVYVRFNPRAGHPVVDWAIDKRTGAVSVAPPWEELTNAPGTVVSGPDPLEVDGVEYSRTRNGLLVMKKGDESRQLFELPGYGPEFVVDGVEVYSASYDGELFRGLVDPLVLPALVETRGELDDDDPYPVIVAADEDAVYWTAGPFSDVQVTDGDPSMLYRTCR